MIETSAEVKTSAAGVEQETIEPERAGEPPPPAPEPPPPGRPRGRSRRSALLTVAAVGVVAVAGLALLFWFYSRGGGGSGAGRPVPAPRSLSVETPAAAPSAGAPAEASLALPADVMARSGIKVEPVGEGPSPEMSAQAATGIVQANAYRTTPVVSLVGGVVRSVGAELGQSVRRGQTMAVIFSDELAMAQSRYLTALADLEEHHQHHQRTARLVEIGAASREEFEQATTKLKTAESESASLRQRLLLLGLTPQRVAELRSSAQIGSEVSLPAPVAGTVIGRSVNPGEVVEANKELLRVADLSSVWVVGQVYERELARVRVGSGASVTSEAYPGRVFRGRVSYVDPQLDPATRTAQVRVELANPGQIFKLGMFVNVAFGALGDAEKVTAVVPASAVQHINNQPVVFVATADPQLFLFRPVRLGPPAGDRYPILEGVQAGERVATEGSFLLRAEWLKRHPTGQAPAHQH